MELNSELERCKEKLYQFKYGVYDEIQNEIERSNKLHGEMPDNLFVQLAIMQEEAGEVTKAVLHCEFENGDLENVRTELIQTAAMCVRMLNSLTSLKSEQ